MAYNSGSNVPQGVQNAPVASLTVITTVATPITCNFLGFEKWKPPARNLKEVKWLPIDGANAFKEQVRAGSEEATQMTMTVIMDPQNYSDMDSLVNGTNLPAPSGGAGATVALNVTGVGAWSGTGSVTKVDHSEGAPDKNYTVDVTISLNAGWTFTPASGAIIIAFTQAMTSGAYTLDLYAAPYGSALVNGKRIQKITFSNPAATAMTVAKGASSGCDELGSSFSATVGAGGSQTFYPAGEGSVLGSTVRTFDFTGTTTQLLTVFAIIS